MTMQTANYMHNQLVYNPAAAGMQPTQFNANVIVRMQWAGVEGAPKTYLLWSDYRFSKNRMAVGVNLNRDSYAATKTTDFYANYAYYVPLTRKLNLSFGLRAGVTNANINLNNLSRIWDAGDPIVEGSSVSEILPKFGGGFQLTSRKLYFGASAPDLVAGDKSNILNNKDKSFFDKRRNYIVTGGYRIKLSDSYSLYPNFITYVYPGTKVRNDFSTLLEITDYFWAGGTFSTAGYRSVMAGTHISSRVRFAYAFEWKTKTTNLTRLNTHEINLMFNLDDLFKKKN